MQVLVLYFSKSGNTKKLAEAIGKGVDEVDGVGHHGVDAVFPGGVFEGRRFVTADGAPGPRAGRTHEDLQAGAAEFRGLLHGVHLRGDFVRSILGTNFQNPKRSRCSGYPPCGSH